MTTTMTVGAALASVRLRMDAACERAGRDRDSVELVAVTKTFPPARIRELLACGHRVLGENRVQEALAKMRELSPEAVWHLVGHLQSNKVRQVVGKFELIHSVDSSRLADEIERRAAGRGIRQGVLLQVNVGEEETKFGVGANRLFELGDAVAGLEHVDLRGLMSIPPPATDAADSRRWFVRLRELRDECSSRLGRPLPELSMGMTDDFEVAIEEGATLIRVGRAIFGERLQASQASRA